MPDSPLTGLEPRTAEEIVRREIEAAVERNRVKAILVIFCVWLVGGITVLGVAYLWATSRNEQFSYAVNANTCNARKLIDKSISDTKKARKRAVSASVDPTATASARARNAQAVKDANRSLVGLRAFRNLYQTVPSHYNCKRLPKNPPGD